MRPMRSALHSAVPARTADLHALDPRSICPLESVLLGKAAAQQSRRAPAALRWPVLEWDTLQHGAEGAGRTGHDLQHGAAAAQVRAVIAVGRDYGVLEVGRCLQAHEHRFLAVIPAARRGTLTGSRGPDTTSAAWHPRALVPLLDSLRHPCHAARRQQRGAHK